MSIAEKMAANQKQVAISEFFEKNKHFLGFDTLTRALITAVKEAVDNALDACEEARILPDIIVQITKIDNKKDILQLDVEDNGPGIPRTSIEKVFGQLLFGSRFHAIRQSRGQQGIGITGVVMYSQLTTGDPTHVESKIATEATAVAVDIGLDTRKNKAVKSNQDRVDWGDKVHGLRIRTTMKAKYQKGRQSVWQYLRMTSIVNPHADIIFIDPDGQKHHWPRVTEKLPGRVEAIKPHPNGIELGQLQRLCGESSEARMTTFLRRNFSGVSGRAAKELCEVAELEEKLKPKSLKAEQIRALLEAFQGERTLRGKPVKLLNPPTSCLSPIEELLIKKGLSKTIDSKFVTTMTRAPNVTQGNPFQIEVGLIFGEGMAADKPVEILRFANRVPLMYQQGGCLLTKAIESVDWRQYGLDQAGGRGVPKGPAAILVHLASTNVQFTSEAKEALSDNEMVMEEGRKAMLEMGRGLRKHLEKKKKMGKTREKFELINDIIPAIAEKSASLLQLPVPDLAASITKIMSAVIAETTTTWNKETKQTDVHIILYNYTSRARSYTILVTWPEKQGGKMIGNELGGRKEATGVWAWKLETLQPGVQTVLRTVLIISKKETGMKPMSFTEVHKKSLEQQRWMKNSSKRYVDRKKHSLSKRILAKKLLPIQLRKEQSPPLQEEVVTQDEPPVETQDSPEVDSGETKQTTLFGGDY
jgi:DNA topoisomerase-6 subunit B